MMKKVDLNSGEVIAKEAAFHSKTEINLESTNKVKHLGFFFAACNIAVESSWTCCLVVNNKGNFANFHNNTHM